MADNNVPDLTPILHGTIGSVAQESRALPAPLLALRRAFTRTLRDYANGTIDRTSVSLRLAALTCVDGDERIWTLGASTGRWYFRSAQARNWTPADPSHWIDHVAVRDDAADADLAQAPEVVDVEEVSAGSVSPDAPAGRYTGGYGLAESPTEQSPEQTQPSPLLPDITRAWLGPQQ